MEIKGKVHLVSDVINVTDKFKKRELVIEFADNPQYPEFPKLEASQDKCALLDGLTIGQEVTVYFNLKGREWVNPKGDKQYFNSLQIWKIDK